MIAIKHTRALFLLTFALSSLSTIVLAQSSAWALSSLTSQSESGSNSSISFVVERGSSQTSCTANWSPQPVGLYPTVWTPCVDDLLRWRFSQYTDSSNFTIALVQTTLISTSTPSTIDVIRSNITLIQNSGLSCSGNSCTLSPTPVPLATTASSFTPAAFDIFYTLLRDDGNSIPCSEAFTFYINDPNVSVLGPLTLGRGQLHQWETICTSYWSCGGVDPSINTWTSCEAPSFKFKKTLPAVGGDQLSNFVLSVTHEFPLLMATSIRGSNAPDYQLTDPDEVGGLDVLLGLQDTAWAVGGKLTSLEEGGIDQTGDCATGCEFGGTQSSNIIDVVEVEIV